jgi:hypothetical protein
MFGWSQATKFATLPDAAFMSFAVGFLRHHACGPVLQGDLGLGDPQVVQALIIASASNNLLKGRLHLGGDRVAPPLSPLRWSCSPCSGIYVLGL